MRIGLSVFFVFVVVVAFAERQPYERYQSIVDKQMFGPLPPGFDPTKSPSEVAKTSAKSEKELTKEQEQIKKSIRFSVMNVKLSGEAYVGFTDSGDPQHPAHYYLKVGETQNGWTVKEADPSTSTMTIANAEGIEVTLQLGGDSATNASAVSRPGATAAQESAANARPQRDRGAGSLFGGLRNRREQRRQLEAQLQADVAKRAEEASQRAEAEKQRAAREAEEKQQREAEREDQRKQLMQIQEELRKAREERESAEKKGRDEGAGNGVSEE